MNLVAVIRLAAHQPPAHHARLRQGEGEKDTDGVEGDQGVGAAAEDDEEHRGGGSQDEDAVREDEAVASRSELPGQEAITRKEEGEAREVRKGGVGGEDEDQHGRCLDGVVQHAVAEYLAGKLGEDGLLGKWREVIVPGEKRDAYEERDEDEAEPGEHDARVFRFRRLESRYAVRDGLHAGQGRASRGEGPQHEEDTEVLHGGDAGIRDVGRGVPTEGPANEAVDNEEGDKADEQVRGQGEQIAGLTQAPEIGEGDGGDEAHPDDDAVVVERGHGRGQGGHAGRYAHGHRQHIVDEEGGARDEPGQRSQIVLGDDVRAAALRVGENGLPVRAHDHGDEGGDGEADGNRVVEGHRPREDENEQDLFRGVGDGGERVRRENRQRGGLGEPLVTGLRRRQRASDKNFLKRVEIHPSFPKDLP